MAQFGFAQHHAGKEGAQRERHAEHGGGAEGDAECRSDHAQREQFARGGACDLPQDPRKQAPADHQHQRDKDRDLAQRIADGFQQIRGAHAVTAAAEDAGQRRQQHQGQYHDQVFDDQPADGDAAVHRIHRAAAFQGLEQHHGAGDGQRQAEYQTGADGPAPEVRDRHAEQRGDGDLHDGAGQGNLAHRQQVVDRKMQADAEHQQHHADLGELAGQFHVGNKAGRVRTDQHAGNQIADQRRQFQPRGDEAEDQRQPEGGGDGGDQIDAVGHVADLRWFIDS